MQTEKTAAVDQYEVGGRMKNGGTDTKTRCLVIAESADGDSRVIVHKGS